MNGVLFAALHPGGATVGYDQVGVSVRERTIAAVPAAKPLPQDRQNGQQCVNGVFTLKLSLIVHNYLECELLRYSRARCEIKCFSELYAIIVQGRCLTPIFGSIANREAHEMKQANILIVEDEPGVREVLRSFLASEGFVIYEASNSAEMQRILAEAPIDLMTLDLGLNGEAGLVLARTVRAIRDVAIIMISAKDDAVDRIVGLEVGADDYIAKPFNLREVLARVRAVLRRRVSASRTPPTEDTAICFGDWRLDVGCRELRKIDGESTALTPAEFNLLHVLAQRPARVLSRDALLDLTKGSDISQFDRSIDTLIGRLRKKIEPDPESPTYIKTVRNAGYIFSRSVRAAKSM